MAFSKDVDISERLEDAVGSLGDNVRVTEEVSPGLLAAVILGVVCTIALLFLLAVLMDRWNKRVLVSGGGFSVRSTKITILDDMCPSPTSEPPVIQGQP